MHAFGNRRDVTAQDASRSRIKRGLHVERVTGSVVAALLLPIPGVFPIRT